MKLATTSKWFKGFNLIDSKQVEIVEYTLHFSFIASGTSVYWKVMLAAFRVWATYMGFVFVNRKVHFRKSFVFKDSVFQIILGLD